jgi:cysteine desulfurase
MAGVFSMIYADYNGSAPVAKDVIQFLNSRFEKGPYSNPNAIHLLGQLTKMGMENARSTCAKRLGTLPKNISFNSGATEGISQVFFSVLHGKRELGKDIILVSGIEHSAVIKTARWYESDEGYKVEIVPTLSNGIVDLIGLEKLLQNYPGRVALVAIMAANNETGVLQPYREISQVCNRHQVTYFSDTTQLIGKESFHFDESGVDFACLSGHKMGALTGTGILLAKNPTTLREYIIGGGQERGIRGGTQNYLGIETLAVALDHFYTNLDLLGPLREKRDEFERKIKEAFPETVIFGEQAPRVASTTYMSIPGIPSQDLQVQLELHGVCVTTSSACSDKDPGISKVLRSMNVQEEIGRGALRISLGPCSELESYDKIFQALKSSVLKLRKAVNLDKTYNAPSIHPASPI